jgi:dTMP kinase
MDKKGIFITFEGVEGAGKTTQIEILKKKLESENIDFLFTREPGGTPIGEKVRGILLDPENSEMNFMTELLLYCASRAQHLNQKIVTAKKEGKVVICDRFSDSTLAYQGYARGIDKSLIEKLQDIVEEENRPDLTFILDIDPEVSLARAKKKSEDKKGDRIEQESMEFHKRVREGFLEIAEKNRDRVILIDGRDSINEIAQKIYTEIKDRIK